MNRRKATEIEAEQVNQKMSGIDVIVNMIYGQLNMTAYMLGFVDRHLAKYNMEFNRKEKMTFNELVKASKRMLYLNQMMTEPIFKVGVFDQLLKDSNQQMRIMLLLLDRTAGNETDVDIFEAELRRLPSKGIISEQIINLFKPII